MKTGNENQHFESENLIGTTKELQKKANKLIKASIPESIFEFQRAVEPVVSSMKKTIEPMSESIRTLGPIVEQAKILTEHLKILQNELKELSPKREETINKMVLNGWTVGSNEGLYIVDRLENMSSSEIDLYLINYYSKNNYEKMFEELDLLFETLDLGYKDQILRIKNVLKIDINNYKIVISTLFTILEYVYDKELGFLNTDNFMKFRDVEKSKKDLEENEKDNFLLVILISAYSVLQNDLENGRKDNVGFNRGTDGVKYSRHSVLHGRIDPNRLKIKDLIQLVILISAIYTLASLEKEYM